MVDGAVGVKEDHRRRIDLAYNVIHVASMDITPVNVQEQLVLPAAVQLLRASISEVISHRHAVDRVEHVEEQEETDEEMAAGEPISRVSMWYMMPKDTNIRSMMMVTSSLISILKMLQIPRSKTKKTRKTEWNQYRSCLWVCGSILSIKY